MRRYCLFSKTFIEKFIGVRSLMAKPQIVILVDIGSTPIEYPTARRP